MARVEALPLKEEARTLFVYKMSVGYVTMGLASEDLQYKIKEVQFFQNCRSQATEISSSVGDLSFGRKRCTS